MKLDVPPLLRCAVGLGVLVAEPASDSGTFSLLFVVIMLIGSVTGMKVIAIVQQDCVAQ